MDSYTDLEDGKGRPNEGYSDFISEAIAEDLKNGRYTYVRTRFPPEPNGWLHIGHAKAISVDFSMAAKFGGECNLRFDDTNPEKEDMSYVEAIKRDIKWLGYDWGDREYYASDYYEYLYEIAVKLIKKGVAYVDDLSEEEIRVYRGTAVEDKNNITYTPPGKDSPYRNRSVEENLDLFARMRAGEFPDGSKTLRAKIDMAHPNLVMRDPVMYRIRRIPHYRVGTQWCIYPMYDFQHPLSDAKEGITHSLCSLEYEIHRPLYEWFIQQAEVFPSRQIEFARLNISKTVLSKRYLLQLVKEGHVSGWDDPRMPTIAGLRRRGYTPEAIRDFMGRIGIAKTDSLVDIALLEHCLREDLNKRAQRVMVVLRPLKLIIDNWPENHVEYVEAINNPEDPAAGTRPVPFGKELWIEQDDFQKVPPPKYYRLYPGNAVRLRYGYIVTCTGYDTDPVTGEVTAVHCTYDPATRGGNAEDNRKVKGTIHWVSVAHAKPISVRLYDYLFLVDRPMDVPPGGSFLDNLNPKSLEVIPTAYAEPFLENAQVEDKFQFERLGYFVRDPDVVDGKPVFNRSVGLKDSWSKIEKKLQSGS
ncbi:MAG TPA: glutamine--tRNA ligase/YqeY domain fusion protein [Termitinemataceae bacterium]|uniref:glutamine--tRNA ligase/YqeY domain fusion protein n=1 Tax=Treponema sp. J25 TaxID=2094121 RepID=UPI00104ABC49|nr:glutamine--tRNA ligase/YqeY domain fusion protein [Treponema sp. J25]TCW61551.1 glutamine--tRNA ligase [Treponema sp. J25]HOK00349.1 glutamine--tRNA ligase/YqeY domain fusion protein [Termitinemataceae bacterium]HOM24546.1 glutamine--tRNA ligase/YqeY domain fusion protein [Termitinemataceae bacterium]HPQ01650.1 glutamine--tRNA ligase/YqeY domain fusion protein [Termitinemataceae bacterium]